MNSWPKARLGVVATHIKDGTHGTHARVESGVPFLSAKNIGPSGKLFWDESDDLISRGEFEAITSVFQPKRDDLLLTIVGSVGRSALFDGSEVAFQRSVAFVRPGPQILPAFLHQASQAVPFTRQLERRSNVTAQAGLYLGELAKVEVPLPPMDAQRRIAAILTGLDKAIEATEALIEKHKQVKAGLLHDLFTRGILPSGAMRPSPSDAPTMYNETPLGPLPKGWAVQSLVELLAPVANNLRSGPFGSALLKHELSESGVPLLGIDNIHVERFVPLYSRFLDRRKFMTLARYAVRPGDVIITIMGTVGRCCVVPDDIGTALSSKHLWTMTLDAGRVIPDLVCWQLNHAPWTRAWFRRGGQGGIMDAIQSSTLKALRLPTPPFEEQLQIAKIYRALQSRIDCDTARLEKLRAQKQGLMQDLLTGKVRVPVPNAEAIA